MPSWRPVLAISVVALVAIWVLFPDYVSLQTQPTPDEFRGLVGDESARAAAAGIADLVFAASYALLGAVAASYVAVGVTRLVATGLAAGAATADVVENLALIVNTQRSTPTTGGIDLMLTAGSVKWGLVFAALVLLLALAGQQWLERRRG